jgi:hypothetical protein
VLYIGELAKLWKENLLSMSRVGGVILNFVQQLAGRSLQLYENKAGEINDGIQKDNVGFNLLLAIVLSNVTRSHHTENQIKKSGQVEGEDSDEMEEVFSSGHLTSNTIQSEVPQLISLLEMPFDFMHKIPFGSFYPARIWTSNVLFSFLYYL